VARLTDIAVVLACAIGCLHEEGAADAGAKKTASTVTKAKSAKTSKASKTSKAAKTTKARVRAKEDKSAQAHMIKTSDAEATPAYRYGRLSKADCEVELTARKIPFAAETEPAAGVLAPVRLTGPLHGVEFRGDLAEKARAESPYEIADCRLVLALDDFAEILTAHDIVEVRHYSMYRPPGKSWPADEIGTRHSGALAFDAGRFIDKTGKVLDVTKDFNGAIDAKTCGDGAAPKPVTAEATELRAILCEAVDKRLFNVVLTPNYNKPHKNHFHLEVTAGVKWFLVH
jgi:hypothetical protein